MESFNERFTEFYKYLIDQKIIKNSSDFSRKLGVSPSTIAEIWSNRSKVGTKLIQNSVNSLNLNANWLFTGKGSILNDNAHHLVLNEPPPTYEVKSLHKLNVDDEVSKLNEKINMLEEIVSLQKKVIDNYEQCHEVSAKTS